MTLSKKATRYGVLLIVVLALFGCGSSDTAQDELIDYINNQFPKFEKLESEVVDTYDSVTGDNYTNDIVLYRALSETIIPKSRKLVDILQNVSTAFNNPEIIELHSIVIDAYDTLFNGFVLSQIAIEKKDSEIAPKANGKFNLARQLQQKWLVRLNELKKKYNVVTN